MICTDCDDTGVVLRERPGGVRVTYACHCPKGNPVRELFPPDDENHEHPIKVKVWNGSVAESGRDRMTKEKDD